MDLVKELAVSIKNFRRLIEVTLDEFRQRREIAERYQKENSDGRRSRGEEEKEELLRARGNLASWFRRRGGRGALLLPTEPARRRAARRLLQRARAEGTRHSEKRKLLTFLDLDISGIGEWHYLKNFVKKRSCHWQLTFQIIERQRFSCVRFREFDFFLFLRNNPIGKRNARLTTASNEDFSASRLLLY